MKDITICLVYFRSLTLKNLEAALHSVSRQDFERVKSLIIFDNNTEDGWKDVMDVVDAQPFPVKSEFISVKHGDVTRTHSWSTNTVVRSVKTPWVLFTRADYLLEFDILQKFARVAEEQPDAFITSNGCHLGVDIQACEMGAWREYGPRSLRRHGTVYDYTAIDAGVWMMRRAQFDKVGGLDERLTAWGHAQTHFQHKLFQVGVPFVQIPEVLFYHPAHGGEKNLDLAHEQLRAIGGNLTEIWSRYQGMRMY